MLSLNEFVAPEHLLDQRVILITGATAGIGRALALACARLGAQVILLGRDQAKLNQVYDAIEALGAPQPAMFVQDLNTLDATAAQGLGQAISDTFGRLDGLVHNAARLGVHSPLVNQAPLDWQGVMQVNLTAPYLLSRALLPLLQKSDAGRMLFMSSSVGRHGRAYWGAYAASKAALENLMQTLADELDNTSVRVNSYNPGGTRTAMRAQAYPAEQPSSVKPVDALMPALTYLLSPLNALHGQPLSYDDPAHLS